MITDDTIRTFLSFLSIVIAMFALINSIKSSYNPKLIIETLHNKETLRIVKFFDFTSLAIDSIMSRISKINFFLTSLILIPLFIPIVIIYLVNEALNYKRMSVCGIHSNEARIILWVRIINPSKYPITIYNVFLKTIWDYNSISDLLHNDFTIRFTGADKKDIIEISKSSNELLTLPITIEPFNFIETYIHINSVNYNNMFQPKYRRVNLLFYTSVKRFTKKIKVYNGDIKRKNRDVSIDIKWLE